MLNWKTLVDDAAHAATLNETDLANYISQQEAPHQDVLRQLIKRAAVATGFMQTTAPNVDEEDTGLPPGAIIGVWRIDELIGKGGMGEVYRVTRSDGNYEQSAALKLMRAEDVKGAVYFAKERQRLAKLEHKGVARVIDGGSYDKQRPYMVMEYVVGNTITAYAAEHQLGQAARLRLFLQLCEAVSHAHGRLILHRDIKSQNVLVDNSGQVRLIDFGIAAQIDGESMQGALTLVTASPEQLLGQPETVASDVFSMGVLLHELLTGDLPQREVSGAMRAQDDLGGDLKAIVNKTLALKGEDRYMSVDALREEVLAVLQCRPVVARGGGRWYRIQRFMARYPVAVSLAVATVLALSLGLFVSLYFASVAREETRQAEWALARSEFFGQRSNMYYEASEAYADSLQHLFVVQAEGSKSTQAELLLKRWQKAMDSAESDPKTASYLSYAIGRQFLFRNDYVNAKMVLSTWLNRDFGEAMLRSSGEELLAVVYEVLGQNQQALALMKKQVRRYEQGYERGYPDHVGLATRIAFLTKDADDISQAKTLLAEAIRNHSDESPSVKMYYHNQMAKLHSMMGDETAAHDAYLKLLAVIERHPAMTVPGVSTGRMNVADFEWYTGRSNTKTLALVQLVLKQSEYTGENRDTGRASRYMAQYFSRQGHHQAAIDAAVKARKLMQRYSPSPSLSWIQAELTYADVLAVGGQVDEAEQVFVALKTTLEADGAIDKYKNLLLLHEKLIHLMKMQHDGGDFNTVKLSCAALDMPIRDLQQRYLVKRLVGAGVSACGQALGKSNG